MPQEAARLSRGPATLSFVLLALNVLLLLALVAGTLSAGSTHVRTMQEIGVSPPMLTGFLISRGFPT